MTSTSPTWMTTGWWEERSSSHCPAAAAEAVADDLVSPMTLEGLDTSIIGRRISFHPELDSTMDEGARLADGGAGEGTTVVAEVQTAGRGRFGRTWISPAGNLWVSILLRPSLDALRYLSILAGVASARAIASTTGLDVTLKWPNDLRIGGLKVGGVLVENSLSGQRRAPRHHWHRHQRGVGARRPTGPSLLQPRP